MSLLPGSNLVTSHVASHRRGASWQSSYELVPAIGVTRPASRGEKISRPLSPPDASATGDMVDEEDSVALLRSHICCPTCGSKQETGFNQKRITRALWHPAVLCLLVIGAALLVLVYVGGRRHQYLETDFGEFFSPPPPSPPELGLLNHVSTRTSADCDAARPFQWHCCL